jgi:hypothetical protein
MRNQRKKRMIVHKIAHILTKRHTKDYGRNFLEFSFYFKL